MTVSKTSTASSDHNNKGYHIHCNKFPRIADHKHVNLGRMMTVKASLTCKGHNVTLMCNLAKTVRRCMHCIRLC